MHQGKGVGREELLIVAAAHSSHIDVGKRQVGVRTGQGVVEEDRPRVAGQVTVIYEDRSLRGGSKGLESSRKGLHGVESCG